jgi:hypothetical protein
MISEKLNILQKMAKARIQLQEAGTKKSGKNTFSKFDYFELTDFLPKINQINLELGLLAVFSSKDDQYILSVYNSDEPACAPIIFACPMASASLKGMHEIQNLGAVITYTRRYIYMMAYEIVENDPLDAGREPSGKKTTTQANGEAGQSAIKAIKEKANGGGSKYTPEMIAKMKEEAQRRSNDGENKISGAFQDGK